MRITGNEKRMRTRWKGNPIKEIEQWEKRARNGIREGQEKVARIDLVCYFDLIDFGIVGVGTLFPDSSCFFPQGFHCRGFNEVNGEVEANGWFLHFILESLSMRRVGVLEKLLAAEH